MSVRTIASVFVCMVCAGHARRVMSMQAQITASERSQEDSLRAFASILQAFNPGGSPALTLRSAELGRSSARLSRSPLVFAQEDDIESEGESIGELVVGTSQLLVNLALAKIQLLGTRQVRKARRGVQGAVMQVQAKFNEAMERGQAAVDGSIAKAQAAPREALNRAQQTVQEKVDGVQTAIDGAQKTAASTIEKATALPSQLTATAKAAMEKGKAAVSGGEA
mmetsp:Transcript_123378/g.227291  ORF Transcript_123378/g.227291 Transcript_123378/m.227291 type:complete len:223 (+) Transcript_123378:72-740(+)